MDLQTIAFTTFSILFIAITAAGRFQAATKIILNGHFFMEFNPYNW